MNHTEFEYLKEVKIKRKTYYLVKKNEQVGLLTPEHKVQIPIEWDELEINKHFSLEDFLHFTIFDKNEPVVVILVKRNHKWGVIDWRGDEIIPVIYDKIEIVSFAGKFYFKVTGNGTEGLTCFNKNVLVTPKWQKIIPASFNSQESDPQFLWARKSDCLFCIVADSDPEKPIVPLVQNDTGHFQFFIYDRYLKLVTPEVLDGYAAVTAGYRLIKPDNNLTYILIRQQDRYGVLSRDIRLINKPVLTYEEAIALIRKQQQNDYIKILIDEIKVDCKKINKYLEQHKKMLKNEVLPIQKKTGAGLTRESNPITKAEIKKNATVLADWLADLGAFKLAEGARKMETQIDNDNHQAFLAIIGDLLEWLQSLKVNPELTFENRPVIEKESDQELQLEYNRGFAEVLFNSEIGKEVLK
ncbi:hypothetical protein GH811_09390 [Acetobacterium malicum]|uniref:Uncharacterized protein n=1 Tax=Acetobacterium malicum TaxID=52692 RepID=A0ABR6YXI9_9FIRM|nr:hypothetical protein [Acetobacterium malicum]MBC3899827.1 hypothetical protein [Acetobacterium malicum]